MSTRIIRLVHAGLFSVFLMAQTLSAWAGECPLGDRNALLKNVSQLYSSSQEARDALSCLSRQLLSLGDGRSVFPIAYIEVLNAYIAHQKDYEDPAWMERMSVMFVNMYRQAFLNFEKGEVSRVPRAWREAFIASSSVRGPEPEPEDVLRSFALGMVAHIVRDLPFAAASLDLTDFEKNRSDYNKTNEILISAIAPILKDYEFIYRVSFKWPFELERTVGALEVRETRDGAWRRGLELKASQDQPKRYWKIVHEIEEEAYLRALLLRGFEGP